MSDYATVAQIKSLGVQTDALTETAWQLLATSCSRFFDRLCEVEDDFFAEENGLTEDKYFVGDGTAYLKLPPYIDIDSVTLNEGTITIPDYQTTNVPEYIEQNGYLVVLDKTSAGFTLTGANRFTGWPEKKQIKVSAVWGSEFVREEVTAAVCHLALVSWRTFDPSVAEDTQSSLTLVDGIPALVWATVEKMRGQYSQKSLAA